MAQQELRLARRLLVWFFVLGVAGLAAGIIVAAVLPDGSAEARWAANVGVACIGPFLVYGFRVPHNALVRRSRIYRKLP